MIKKVKDFLYINNEIFVLPIIEKIKTKAEYRRLFSNFMFLSILQVADYIFPLITFPYLVRVLGVEKFGLLSFAQAFIQYFIVITDYGFNLTATREISIHRNNKEKISEIFSNVMIIKCGLFLMSFIIMSGVVFGFEKFRREWLLYYLTFGMVLGHVLFPVWFFQGIEDMKWITYLNIVAKGIFAVAVFVFVKNPNDYCMVPVLISLGYMISGIISLYLILKKFKVSFKISNFLVIKDYMVSGCDIFISKLSISFYTNSTTFILGIFSDDRTVGYFASADKIIQVFKSFMIPISNSIYPYISLKISNNRKEGIMFINKIFLYVSVFTFILSFFVLILSDRIVIIVLGSNYIPSILLLKIMSFLPFIIGLSNILGINGLLVLKNEKSFKNIILAGSFLSIILSLIFVPFYKAIATSVIVVLVEVYITIAMFVSFKRTLKAYI